MPEMGSKAWNDLIHQEEHKLHKIKHEKVSNIKVETDIEKRKRISTRENNSKKTTDTPKYHLTLKSDKVMFNVKQERVVENYEALKEEKIDPLCNC